MKSSMRKIAAGLLGGMMIAAGAAVIPASAGQIFTTPATVAKVGDKTPVIDGVYSPDEGWGDPITTVTYDMTQQEGAYLSLCDTSHPELLQDKDLIPSKVDVYMRWDEKALYYCAVVVQEKRYNDVVSEGDIWKMDSIIFNITSKDDDDDKNRIGLGVTNDGTILANVYATEGGTYGCDNLADWKVTRNEETKTTTYEVPFLWEEIMENEKVPTGTLKFRDLLMPTSEAGQENPVDFNLSGIAENGKYKYWDLTFADSASGGASAASAAPGNWVSSSFTSSFDDPDWHASAEDIEFEDSYVADATNCLMNDGSYYVFLKNFGKGDYSVEFEAKEDGLYEIGICLMAWQKSVPRATNVKVDDSDWVRLEFDYNDEDKQLEQFITGLTINLTKGTHKLTLGLPEGHDDTTLKTLYFDYFFTRKVGEMGTASAAPASAPAASADYVTDGLFAWYDGANNQNGSQDKKATVWKDATGGGHDFEVELNDTNYWTDNAFHLDSVRNYLPDEIVDLVNGDHYTVEFAAGDMEFPATDWVSLLISDNDHFSLFIRMSNDNLEYKYNDANKDRPMADDGQELVRNSTVAITFDIDEQECDMYVDGVLVSENIPLETNIADTLMLGHEDERRIWNGDVYAMRFYNRALTAAEVAQNAAADNAKYRGGAALPAAAPADTAAETPASAVSGFKKVADAAAAVGMTPITGYEWEDGTNGFGGEGPENLWDGDTATKFCTNEFPAESVASLDGTYKVTGFTMATANDNADYNGRSPNAWTISVSADGENWTELAKGDDSFFEEKNFTYYNGEGTAEGVAFVKFEAEGTASGTFQVSEVTLYGEKTGDKPVKEEPAPEPEPEPEPEPTVEEVAENAAEEVVEAVENAAEAAGEAVNNAAEAAGGAVDNAKSGCGSFIGGGLIVLVTVLGSAWAAKRR